MVGSSRTHLARHAPHAPHGGPARDDAPEGDANGLPAIAEPTAAFAAEPLTLGLVHLGLSGREAQLYHSLLKYGPVSARHAIQYSHLDRATGYRVLARLRVRGLIAATGHRPQQFVALEIGRLFERVTSFLRDDLDLHRTVREIYQSELLQGRGGSAAPRTLVPASEPVEALPRVRSPTYRLLPRGVDVGRYIVQSFAAAKEEVSALVRPQLVPEPYRSEAAQAIGRAVARGIRVRLVLDYHAPEVEFLAAILRAWDGAPAGLEVRFFAPQFARLYLTDRKVAMRCVGTPGQLTLGPEIGVVSEDGEFLRAQTARFQTVWRDALPMENVSPTAAAELRTSTPSSSRELRHWVEHSHRAGGRSLALAPWEYGPPRHPVLR